MLKLYIEIVKLLFKKFILRQNTGKVIKKFSEKMGIVYIKLAQILAMQNLGNIFTEEDRKILSSLCDNCNPLPFKEIKAELELNYKTDLNNIFLCINEIPVGSASISQVHKGVLKTGEVVAIKIKRKDISLTIKKDVNNIRKLMNRWGKIINFKNFLGGSHGLDLYISWIEEETDFNHEKENILRMKKFAKQVNNKIDNSKEIVLPDLYEKYCTDNVIVMEFIEALTINKLELNVENQQKIQLAVNSYLQNTFYALFHDMEIIFHGDPHSGNIYIDESGNIGFLDMGLVFTLTKEDKNLLLQFFMAAYTNNTTKLYNLLEPYGIFTDKEKSMFQKDINDFCNFIKDKPVTMYFTDMMTRVLKYNFDPPKFLYCMAKPFLCLNGMNIFSNNSKDTIELLQEQVMEYFIRHSFAQTTELLKTGVKEGLDFTKNIFQKGFSNSLSKFLLNSKMKDQIIEYVEFNYQALTLLKSTLKK